MRQGKKWVAVTGALLASCILTGCDTPRTVDAFLGNERTLPDGDEVVFNKPHRPILNPLNNTPPATDMPDTVYEGRMSYDNPGNNSTPTSTASRGGRHIPQENVALLNGNAAPVQQVAKADITPSTAPSDSIAASSAAQVASVKAAPANPSIDSALDTALAKQPDPIAVTTAGVQPNADEQKSADAWNGSKSAPAAVQAAPEPVAPQPTMGTIKLTPPSSPNPGDTSSLTSATPVMASAQTTAPADSQATANDAAAVAAASAGDQPIQAAQASGNGYPTLSSVPDAPKRTPDKDIASDIKSLTADRTSNQAAGTALMNNPDSTVMTSPKTGELVTDPAKAMAAASPSAGGNDLTVPPVVDAQPASDTITKALEAQNQKNAVTTTAGSASDTQQLASASPAAGNATPQTAPANPAIDSALDNALAKQGDPIALTASAPATTTAPVTAPVDAPVVTAAAAAPSAGTASAPASTMDVVHLNPPTTIAEAPAAASPDANKQLTDVVTQGEVEPTPAPVTYLPENRYAKRRLAPISDAY